MIKIFVAVVGILVSLRLFLFFAFPLQLQDGQEVSFQTTLFSDPVAKGGVQQLSLTVGDFWHALPLTLVFPKTTDISYGQTVWVVGKISKKVLNNERTAVAIYFPKIKAKNGPFLPIFGKIRQEINVFCEKTFSQPYGSLFMGILFGIQGLFGKGISISFRITGVTHVIAASGMNVTLVGGFLLGIVSRFVKRRLALVITIGGILFYTVLSGLGASIVRAAIMGIIAFSGQFFGRQYTPLYGVFLAAAGMLFFDPLLLQNVGFQLSIFSTLGIIFVKPLIPLKGFLLDDIGTTLSAQLATLPILLSTFGTYGLLSLLVNALVLWTVPLIMMIGGVGVGIGLIFQPLGSLVLQLCQPLLWYFVAVVEYFAQFNYVLQVGNFSVFLVAGYYLLLLSMVFLSQKRVN